MPEAQLNAATTGGEDICCHADWQVPEPPDTDNETSDVGQQEADVSRYRPPPNRPSVNPERMAAGTSGPINPRSHRDDNAVGLTSAPSVGTTGPASRTRPTASEIARRLAGQITALTLELLPHGRREGSEWTHPSLTGTSRRSLSVHLTGAKAGVWCDFSSGVAGDALDLVAQVRFAGDRKAAFAWARDWLGQLPAPSDHATVSTTSSKRIATSSAEADQAARKAKAVALFRAAPPGLADTPAALYLAGREIELAALGHAPRALRFHPAIWCQEAGRKLPAMLAAIINSDGVHLATHRTWIVQNATGHWTKAPLRNPKKTLGSYAGGFIPLQDGAAAGPLHTAPEGEVVAIAEGIETALSVAVACPELRVLAAVSLANLARIALPPAVRTVILCADNDAVDNHAARRALAAAVDHFAGSNRIVRLARPPLGKDFNDTLCAGGRA